MQIFRDTVDARIVTASIHTIVALEKFALKAPCIVWVPVRLLNLAPAACSVHTVCTVVKFYNFKSTTALQEIIHHLHSL